MNYKLTDPQDSSAPINDHNSDNHREETQKINTLHREMELIMDRFPEVEVVNKKKGIIKMKISILILNYNGKYLMEKCLLEKQNQIHPHLQL